MKYLLVLLSLALFSCGGDDDSEPEGIPCFLTEAGIDRFVRCEEAPETERIIRREVVENCEACQTLLSGSL